MNRSATTSGSPSGDQTATDNQAVQIVIVLLFGAAICFTGLRTGPAMTDHECLVAQTARQIRQSGQWLIPYYNETPRVRKPPLAAWLVATASWLLDDPAQAAPVSEFTARLPSALAGLFNVLMVYLLGRWMFGHRVGLVAALIMSCSVATMFYSHSATTDMLMTALTTSAFACFWRATTCQPPSRRWIVLFYLALGLAMMAKAPLPLAVVALPLTVYWLIVGPIEQAAQLTQPTRRSARLLRALAANLRQIPALLSLPGLAIFLLVAGAWPVYVYLKIDGVLALWRTEFIDRYAGLLSPRPEPWWYYLPWIFLLVVPYCLSLPHALIAPAWRRFARYRHGLLFAATWLIADLLFLSGSAEKKPHYLLPVAPALVLMLAPVIDRLFLARLPINPRRVRTATVALVIAAVIGLAAALPLVIAHYRALLGNYIVAAALTVATVLAACLAYQRGLGRLSLAVLNAGALIVFSWVWPALSTVQYGHDQAVQLARLLRQHNLSPDQPLIWVHGRPDAQIAFYSRWPLRRLLDEIDLANRRRGRAFVPGELLTEAAETIIHRLASPQPAYLLISAEWFDRLQRFYDVPGRVLLRLSGFHEDPGDQLLVLTNQPIEATRPRPATAASASAPASSPSTQRQ